jgi:hypothetical protein
VVVCRPNRSLGRDSCEVESHLFLPKYRLKFEFRQHGVEDGVVQAFRELEHGLAVSLLVITFYDMFLMGVGVVRGAKETGHYRRIALHFRRVRTQ